MATFPTPPKIGSPRRGGGGGSGRSISSGSGIVRTTTSIVQGVASSSKRGAIRRTTTTRKNGQNVQKKLFQYEDGSKFSITGGRGGRGIIQTRQKALGIHLQHKKQSNSNKLRGLRGSGGNSGGNSGSLSSSVVVVENEKYERQSAKI